MGQWFYTAAGTQTGPVDTAELRRLATAGVLLATDLVWREGMSEWVPATKVQGLFASGPPDAEPGLPQPAAADEASGTLGERPAAALPDDGVPLGVLPYQGGGVPVGVSARTVTLLSQTRPWVLFFSVLGFLGAGLMLVVGLGVTIVGATASRQLGLSAWIGLVYIAVSAVYLVPALFLWRYGSRIGNLLARGHLEDLELALEAQKSFWRFSGILVLVVIVLYFVGIAIAIAVSVM